MVISYLNFPRSLWISSKYTVIQFKYNLVCNSLFWWDSFLINILYTMRMLPEMAGIIHHHLSVWQDKIHILGVFKVGLWAGYFEHCFPTVSYISSSVWWSRSPFSSASKCMCLLTVSIGINCRTLYYISWCKLMSLKYLILLILAVNILACSLHKLSSSEDTYLAQFKTDNF